MSALLDASRAARGSVLISDHPTSDRVLMQVEAALHSVARKEIGNG